MRARRLVAALAAALLAACGSYTVPDEVTYGQAVLTQPKPGFDFGPLRTYYLDPTADLVTDGVSAPEALPPDVTNAITTALGAYGWSPETLGSAGVSLTVLAASGTNGTYPPGYWCNYSGYTGCYAGWGYTGVYQTSAVVLQMGGPLPSKDLLWMAALYGVGGGGWNDPGRLDEALRRAFSQSPYLAH